MSDFDPFTISHAVELVTPDMAATVCATTEAGRIPVTAVTITEKNA